MSGTPTHVTLSALSIDEVNIRLAARGEAEPAFIGSIEHKGIIEPLIVRPSDDGFKIVNGGKRFAALQHMMKKGMSAAGVAVTASYSVPIIVREEDDGAATETSLITNIVRAPTHPVDQFEAFAELVKFGDTIDNIARRYGMKMKEVRQALSLAQLAPEIREAWRAGKIDGDAAEIYAQTKDLAHQVRIFNKLKGSAGDSWRVREEIAGDRSRSLEVLLKFVGVKEYEAAGHQVNPSLFGGREDDVTVDNIPALKAMAAAKIAAECERLKGDGWGWVIPKDEAPNDIYAWRRLPGGNPSKEQKAAAGCTVGIDYAGIVDVTRGYIKPGEKVRIEKTPAQKKAAEKAKATKDETGGISGGLAFRLSQQITHAAHDALRTNPLLALRVAIAGMACQFDSPAQIRLSGMAELGDDGGDYEFAKYFKLTENKTTSELLQLLATWTARSLDMVCHSAFSLPLTGDRDAAGGAPTLLNALPSAAMNEALLEHFDSADYFKSVSSGLIRAALEEMGAPKVSAAKKADLVDVATARQKDCGWLPRELRTVHYAGPGAKTVSAKTAVKRKSAPERNVVAKSRKRKAA